MSRTDYDDCESNVCYLWDSIVARAIEGKRGQKALREIEAALLALPQKRLIKERFARDGEVCTLGALALKRGLDDEKLADLPEVNARATVMDELAHWECDTAAEANDSAEYNLGLARSLASTIQGRNDAEMECGPDGWRPLNETPEERYVRMLAWVRSKIKPEAVAK